mmetsp:Transcript_9299/g.25117  ORF Transcript_9299/g.25117 Transcript_9299/m.25117 type:complete len:249 (-) Transcript_9299:845-1591(-)
MARQRRRLERELLRPNVLLRVTHAVKDGRRWRQRPALYPNLHSVNGSGIVRNRGIARKRAMLLMGQLTTRVPPLDRGTQVHFEHVIAGGPSPLFSIALDVHVRVRYIKHGQIPTQRSTFRGSDDWPRRPRHGDAPRSCIADVHLLWRVWTSVWIPCKQYIRIRKRRGRLTAVFRSSVGLPGKQDDGEQHNGPPSWRTHTGVYNSFPTCEWRRPTSSLIQRPPRFLVIMYRSRLSDSASVPTDARSPIE